MAIFIAKAMQIHENSLRASHQELPGLHTRALDILAWIKVKGAVTDRECAAGMGYAHRSMCQPRITELIKAGFLEECGQTKCPITGKTVRLVRWKE